MHETTANTSQRELAFRENDGLQVALLWDERSGRLTVTVSDSRTDERFSLDAAPDRALDVFHHPFSYAASRTAPRANLLLAA